MKKKSDKKSSLRFFIKFQLIFATCYGIGLAYLFGNVLGMGMKGYAQGFGIGFLLGLFWMI